MLRTLPLIVLSLLLSASEAGAQPAQAPTATSLTAPALTATSLTAPAHYCASDLTSLAARAAIDQYHAAKASGLFPAARKTLLNPPDVGDRKRFYTYDDAWIGRDFELRDVTSEYYLWVEVGEWSNGNVTQSKVDALRDPLLLSTPSGSINSGAGVMANNRAYFGDPPNYDGDGLVDILLYDIAQSGVGGYVVSTDINPDAPAGEGNQADVLYIDSRTGNSSLAAIAAHEYTHLIHFAYNSDVFTFVTEGLAEYSMVMNAVAFRSPTFLADKSEQSIPLFDWRGISAVGGLDYQRANLFYSYIADRIGPVATAAMVRSGRKGTAGLNDRLREQGLTLRSVVLDYHTTNLVNDRSVDPIFGYSLAQRQGFRTPATTIIDGAARNSYSQQEEVPIEGGAVRFIRFDTVTDPSVTLQAGNAIVALRDVIRARMVLVDLAGNTTWADLEPRSSAYTFPGAFESATLVTVHTDPETARGSYLIDASWTKGAEVTDRDEDPSLPDRVTLSQNYPNPFNPQTTIEFALPSTGPVRLDVFDALGRIVRTLVNGTRSAGTHSVHFESGRLPSGTYFYVLAAAGDRQVRQLTVLR